MCEGMGGGTYAILTVDLLAEVGCVLASMTIG